MVGVQRVVVEVLCEALAQKIQNPVSLKLR